MKLNQKLIEIMEESKELSFPLLVNEKKKYDILNQKRYEYDSVIMSLLSDSHEFIVEKDKIWEDVKGDVLEEFENLPNKLKINSFYYQEIMYRYLYTIKERFFEEV